MWCIGTIVGLGTLATVYQLKKIKPTVMCKTQWMSYIKKCKT